MRLPIALWVRARPEGTSFFLKEAADGSGYDSANVAQELARLVELRMLMRHEATPGDRRVYFTPLETPLWSIVDAARVAVGAQGR